MSKVAGLIQLKSGDAVSGIVSRRAPFFRFLKVEMAELHNAQTQEATRADGVIWVPRSNILFFQQIQRVINHAPQGPAVLPGPKLTSDPRQPNEAPGTPTERR
jgi:hypothetical protein